MGKLIDLTGKTFNYLTVESKADIKMNNHTAWNCRCICGNTKIVDGVNLKNGHVKSCGCVNFRLYRGLKDLTGQKFGMLTVTNEHESRVNDSGKRRTYWKCICDCGNEKYIEASCLKKGNTVSCGCKKKKQFMTHGLSDTRLYEIWTDMKQRCYNPRSVAYEYYGGRGIAICDEWKNDFMAFYSWANENGYADNLTIERKDFNGNYEPDNCCWITLFEQQGNTRRNTFLTNNGEKHTVAEWARIKGVRPGLIWGRLGRGWSVEDALNVPLLSKGSKYKCAEYT